MATTRTYTRVFIMEDLSRDTIQALSASLTQQGFGAGMEGMFWLPVPQSSLHGIFLEHSDCLPYRMSLELGKDYIRLELLMRGSGGGSKMLVCTCIGYGGAELEMTMIAYLESLLEL